MLNFFFLLEESLIVRKICLSGWIPFVVIVCLANDNPTCNQSIRPRALCVIMCLSLCHCVSICLCGIACLSVSVASRVCLWHRVSVCPSALVSLLYMAHFVMAEPQDFASERSISYTTVGTSLPELLQRV